MAKKLWKDDVTPAGYSWSVLAPSVGNWTDVTNSVIAWYNSRVLDFYTRRNKAKSIIEGIAGSDYSLWASLSGDEKMIAVNWCLAPYSIISTEPGFDAVNHSLNASDVAENNKLSRGSHIDHIKEYFEIKQTEGVITNADKISFYDTSRILMENYISPGDLEFHDWVQSTGVYSGDGFSAESYYSVTFRDDIMDILDPQ